MYRVLVVGAGSIGQRHIRNLLGLDRELVVTVAEPSPGAQEAVRTQFGLQVVDSPEEAVDASAFEVALICSPNHLHVPHAKLLADHGCHLLVEKPLAVNRHDALSLAPHLERSGVMLMVGCNLRFHPGVRAMSNAIAAGSIGRVLYARAQFAHYLPNWRPGQDYRLAYSANRDQGGGILLDDIHEPDYLSWLLGKVDRVMGMLPTLGDLELDVEDVADYVMWHDERRYSHVHADYLRRDKIRGCELIGTEGSIVWRSQGKNPEAVRVKLFDARKREWEELVDEAAYDPNNQYVDEVKYFLSCLDEGSRPMNGLSEAVHIIDVLDAVREANRTGCVQPIPKDAS